MKIKVLDNKSIGFKTFFNLLKVTKTIQNFKFNVKLSSPEFLKYHSFDNYNDRGYDVYYTIIKDRNIRSNYVSPQQLFHNIITLLYNGDEKKKKILHQKWNILLTELLGINTYVDICVETLKEINKYNDLKLAYSIYFKKDVSDDDMRNILKEQKLKSNFYYHSCFNTSIYQQLYIIGKYNHLKKNERLTYEDIIKRISYICKDKFNNKMNQLLHEIFSKEIDYEPHEI